MTKPFVLVVLAACATQQAPTQTQTPTTSAASLVSTEACAADSDCTISNFRSCCTSCSASAYATSKRELARRERVCTVVDCAMNGQEQCAPFTDAALYRAVCRAGTCGGVRQ